MRYGRITVAGIVIILQFALAAVAEQRLEPIRYTLRFPAPQTNYVEVEAVVPTEGRPAIEMMMAVWTPGSYLIREYERNVENVVATANGRVLAVDKTTKNRWRIETGGAREIALTYRVYCHEMTVRSNWVEADFAMLNGAPTFMTLAPTSASVNVGTVPRQHDVRLELPPGWKTSVSALPDAQAGQPNHYIAADYDTLVDSPLVAGNPDVHRFTVDGKPHLLVDVAGADTFDGVTAARDLEKIVAEQERFWGSLPYEKYIFFNVLTGGGGAIEHKNSVMIMANRWATGTHGRYVRWLSTASHEYFHLWNVKRLRPIELGPFDYERENYPRSLWISEGLTDYYADVILARAGLVSLEEYLGQLSSAIRALQTTPGRFTQTAELASFDAWIKEYRPDENSVNSEISYYTKGAVIGFLLDARIRQTTGGAKSLDDVMRLAFQRYSGAHGFTPEQFRQVASDVAGADLGAWFHRALDTTEEFDYTPALVWYGLEFRTRTPRGEPMAWLGATTEDNGGRLMVKAVPRGTPAYDAGVNPGDEILAIDDYRVRPGQLEARLRACRGGQKIVLLVARRGDELRRLNVTLGAPQADPWNLAIAGEASPDQHARIAAWLSAGRNVSGR